MREIKFRAFNKETGKMLSFKQLKAISVLATSRIEGLFIPDDTRMIWMQFTGLMDKNGVEIFEGDIVNAKLTGLFDENFLSTIEFENGCFGIRSTEDGILVDGKGKFKSFDGCDTTDRIEIIGNIYENPDLLKSVDKGIEERS
jgi:uncharacterized phage protein (TIGR01671 family)